MPLTVNISQPVQDDWAEQDLRGASNSGLEMSYPNHRKQILKITREFEEDNQEAKYSFYCRVYWLHCVDLLHV